MAEGAAVEAEWNSDLAAYESKYPELAKEFKQLISGDLPEGWEKALPVSDLGVSKFGADCFGSAVTHVRHVCDLFQLRVCIDISLCLY